MSHSHLWIFMILQGHIRSPKSFQVLSWLSVISYQSFSRDFFSPMIYGVYHVDIPTEVYFSSSSGYARLPLISINFTWLYRQVSEQTQTITQFKWQRTTYKIKSDLGGITPGKPLLHQKYYVLAKEWSIPVGLCLSCVCWYSRRCSCMWLLHDAGVAVLIMRMGNIIEYIHTQLQEEGKISE